MPKLFSLTLPSNSSGSGRFAPSSSAASAAIVALPSPVPPGVLTRGAPRFLFFCLVGGENNGRG